MARRSLTDVLGDDTPPEPRRTPPAPRQPEALTPSAAGEERVQDDRPRYKFTAMMRDSEYDELRSLTDAIVEDLAPRPVGKGWQAKVVRTLVALAAEDTAEGRKMRKRIVAHLRKQ